MCKLSTLLGIALFVSTVSSAANTCKRGNVVHMPNSVPSQFYWPSTWNENTTAPKLEANQDCSWTVTVPKGFFAKLIIDGKVSGQDSRFQIIDSSGNLLQSTHEKKEPYYFPPVKFTLAVSNEAAATFAFKITWAPIPNHPSSINGVGGIPRLENATNAVYNNYYDTSNSLSLLVFPEDIHNSVHLRSVLLFESQGQNDAAYMSSLELVYKTGKQYISVGGSIQLVNVEASSAMDYFLVQEYDLVKSNAQYKALECNQHSNCTVTVDGKKQQSAVVTVPHGNETLVDVQMDPAANISIYFGSQDNFGFYKSYTGAEIKSVLPFGCTWVTQFVISSGKAVLSFLT